LYIPEALVKPTFDGTAEIAWDQVGWNPIDKVWMPWNNESANLGQSEGLQLHDGANDFTGNFKVMWSSETNLLYFLVEIIDDVFVDGYVYNENPSSGGGYPNYDIVEIFIDEDRSGGLHVFDGTGSVASSWGSNAENAFAYHMAVDAPAEGEIQNSLHALDIAGTNWGFPSQKIPDYADHFPEFAMKKEGNKYTWEFTLLVHSDNYNHANQQASVVELEEGKIMGLSMAYCDNDNATENPLRRDHFFGSVDVPLSAHNDHWKNADWFGVAKLTGSSTTSSQQLLPVEDIKIYFANQKLVADINSSYSGAVQIRVVNILGAEVFRANLNKTEPNWKGSIQVNDLHKGIYLVEILQGNTRKVEKISVR
jgi:hypothetical protein